MTQPSVHLFIITGQTQANLIPILQLKPEVVALAVTADMRGKADEFSKLLTTLAGYADTAILRYDGVPDADVNAIEDKALEIADDLQQRYPGAALTFHATGGTKLMTLGFCEVFKDDGNQILYTDTAHQRIETVHPKHQPALPIASVLDIKNYLQAQGKQYRRSADEAWQQRATGRKALGKWLAANAPELGYFFTIVNGMAADALADSARGQAARIDNPQQRFKHAPRGLWLDALQKFKAHGLCQWDESNPGQLYFHDAAGAEYLGGQWLEEYVWQVACEAKPDNVQANVEFTELAKPKDDIRNELDCVVVHHNRLLMMECKTVIFKTGADKNSVILDKLDSLAHRAGGLYGTTWLVSARPLDHASEKRAAAYRIRVISAAGLTTLKESLQDWMKVKK